MPPATTVSSCPRRRPSDSQLDDFRGTVRAVSPNDSDPCDVPAALAATIHDTTNALTVVLGWIERASQPEVDREYALERAATHARWARDQLRGLIGAREPQALAAPTVDAQAVSALIRRTTDDLALEAARADASFELHFADDAAATLVTAPLEAWQVLTNLLLNALAVSPRGGSITITASSSGAGRVRFAVEDDGPGIPLAGRDALFTGRRSTRIGGAGIGLRGARALAREHGGDLVLAASRTRGARFEVEWPTKAAPAPSSVTGLRIVLLEDDSAIVELLDLSLRARGASVTAVRTVPELEAALASAPFDVMLLDLSPLEASSLSALGAQLELPRLTALGRVRVAQLTVLAISGSVASFPSDKVPWLRKPFTPTELVDAILRARGDAP